jgi:hypothetical protein
VRIQISRANLLKKIVGGAAGVSEITGSIAISVLHYWKFAVEPFGEDGPGRIPQAVEIKHFDDKFRRVT